MGVVTDLRFEIYGLALQEFGDGFGAGSDLEFFVDAPDVGVDSLVADAEFLGDFFVD